MTEIEILLALLFFAVAVNYNVIGKALKFYLWILSSHPAIEGIVQIQVC